MVTIERKILVPAVLLASTVGAIVAYMAWDSAQQARTMERDTHTVRTATALAVALDGASQDEERCVLSVQFSSRDSYEACVGDASERIAGLVGEIQALTLPPRAAAVWNQFLEARAALLELEEEVTAAARRADHRQVSLALSKWRLMSDRSAALLKNFSSYFLRFLDRTVAELQGRRTRALWAAAIRARAGALGRGGALGCRGSRTRASHRGHRRRCRADRGDGPPRRGERRRPAGRARHAGPLVQPA